MEFLAIAVVYGAIFAVVCFLLADKKHLDTTAWAIFGFLFGIFALIVLALSKDGTVTSAPNAHWTCTNCGTVHHPSYGVCTKCGTPRWVSQTKKCPMCAEEIKFEAKMCRFCGTHFTEEQLAQAIPPVVQKTRSSCATTDGVQNQRCTLSQVLYNEL